MLRWKGRLLLKEEISSFVTNFYIFLQATENVEEKKNNFFDKLTKLEQKLIGPYFLGNYSYIDVAVYPFFERIQILFPHYKKLDVFEKFPRFQVWFDLLSNRPAVKTTCTRSDVGINSHIYPGDTRDDYIRAVYYPYHSNKLSLVKPLYSKLPLQRISHEAHTKMIDNL